MTWMKLPRWESPISVRSERIPARRDHRAEEGDQHAEGSEHDDVEQRLRWQLRRWRRSRSGKDARLWWWKRRDSSRHDREAMTARCLGEEVGTGSGRRAQISPSKKRMRERCARPENGAGANASGAGRVEIDNRDGDYTRRMEGARRIQRTQTPCKMRPTHNHRHQRTEGGEIFFCYRDHPRSAARVVAFIIYRILNPALT
jgi:hypothetical protein